MSESKKEKRDEYRRTLRVWINSPEADHIVGVLIVSSVIMLILETMHPEDSTMALAGWIINLIFLLELSLRYLVAKSKPTYFQTYWVDILSLLPLLFPTASFLRALRLLRIFRLGPLLRQSNRRFRGLFRQTWGEQITIASIIIVVVAGAAIALVDDSKEEFDTLSDTLWWSVLSIMAGEPVGAMPTGVIGKVFTLVIMVGGLTIFALFTGTVSAVITERLRMGMSAKALNPDELDNHVILCGWNRSSRKLLEELLETESLGKRAIILIAERKPSYVELPEEHPRFFFIEDDYTKMEVLNLAGVKSANQAILLADKSIPDRSDQDRDARTILAALMIEKLNPRIFTCAELLSRDNEQHLRLAGIEEVVIGDEYSATIMATSTRIHGVTEIVDEIFSAKYGNQLFKKEIKKEWVGKTFLELQNRLKMTYDAMLIAVEKASSGEKQNDPPYARTITNPPSHYEFKKGDKLVLFAHKDPRW